MDQLMRAVKQLLAERGPMECYDAYLVLGVPLDELDRAIVRLWDRGKIRFTVGADLIRRVSL